MQSTNHSPSLYNEDLAPATERKWGAFSIFNVWTSDVHSLWGYYLAASLFLLCGSFLNFILAIGIGSLVIFVSSEPGSAAGSELSLTLLPLIDITSTMPSAISTTAMPMMNTGRRLGRSWTSDASASCGTS